jgi:ketosteroid isomerase-like protein
MIRRITLPMLFVILLVGYAKAQEASGDAADAVKKEILKLEEEKRACFLSTTSSNNYCADWIKNHDADGLVHVTGPEARMRSKVELMNELKTGNRKLYRLNQHDHQVHVYGNGGDGTTAVVHYISDTTIELYGKGQSTIHASVTTVYYKQNGTWWTIVHHATIVPANGSEK